MNILNILKEEKETAELILVRGIPGSGKTTYVKNNLKGHRHYEADMFFNKDGKYDFDKNKLGKAHNWCFNQTKKDLENGKKVVVSNTFTTAKEVNKYLKLAKDLNKKVKVIRTTGNYKNIHDVPKESIDRMKKRFVDIDNEIKI